MILRKQNHKRDSPSPERENPVMRKQLRLFHHTRLVLASLLLAVGTGVAAQGSEDHAGMAMDGAAPAAITRTVKWSDASAWPSGKVPAAGEEVTIPRGTEMMLDVSPPELRSLTVQGKLTFADERDFVADHRLDLRPRRRAADRQRGQALHPQGHHHPDRQGQGREHQHHGRPRHHAAARHAQPARQSRP